MLPIWVGVFEARAIAMEMEQVAPPRPMTHDLIKNIIEGVKAQVTNVVIIDLKDNTFYAQIALHTVAASLQIDTRPSDAIALALRVKAPIYVAKTVLDRAPAIERHGGEPTGRTVLKHHGVDAAKSRPRWRRIFSCRRPTGCWSPMSKRAARLSGMACVGETSSWRPTRRENRQPASPRAHSESRGRRIATDRPRR